MHYTIVGAGAIGGALAGHLVRHGHPVLLVEAAPEKIAAIRRDGLVVTGKDDYTVAVDVVAPQELAAALGGRPPEAVLLAVKSQYTAMALSTLKPLLGADSFVVSMQNGLNPHLIRREIGDDRTVGAFLNTMGAYSTEPGRIVYGGPGRVYIGELDGSISDRVAAIADGLRDGFAATVTVTDNIWGCLWGKAAYGTMFFVSSIGDETMARVTGDPANRVFMTDIVGEVMGAADLEGVACESFDGFDPGAMRLMSDRDWASIHRSWDSISAVTARSTKPKSGIWIDLAVRRTATEVDYMVGLVGDIAREHGAEVPLVSRLVEMVHEAERGERVLGPHNLEELRAFDLECYPIADEVSRLQPTAQD